MKTGRKAVVILNTIFVLGFLVNCGGGGSGSSGPVQLGDVLPYFPTAGAGWNDYVKNDQASIYTATDTAATGAETGSYSDAVIHGGEMRALPVPELSSCPGVTASDSLGVFDWACVELGGDIQVVSTGLKDGKYLADLVDFTTAQWKENTVTVFSGGSTYGYSSTALWWSNPVYERTTAGVLGTEGAVYAFTADPGEMLNITANRVSVVVQPGITVRGSGTSGAVVWATMRDFIWVEGDYDAVDELMGIQFNEARFSVVRGANIEHAESDGIYLSSSTGCRMSEINVSDNLYGLTIATNEATEISDVNSWGNSAGIRIGNASDNTVLRNIISANNEGEGIIIQAGTGHLFSNIKAYNNGFYGLRLDGIADSVLSNILLASNENNGIQILSTLNSVIMNMTSVNGGNNGIRISGSDSTTISGAAVANNNYMGVNMDSSDNMLFANVTSTDNEFNGLQLSSSDNSRFTGILKVGSNGIIDCNVSGGVNPGLDNSCVNAGDSDAVLSTNVTSAASFAGKVAVDDTVNISDSSGSATYGSISDWTGFESVYRTWGRDGAAFASTTHQGYADSTETLRIWDWSLAASGDLGDSGTPVLLDVLDLPSGNDTLSHAWAGTTTVTTFLSNAQEVQGDGIGNDNLLCETGEVCQYMPNIGVYQGHGLMGSAGSFTPGAVTDVTLMRYTVNGR
jgi:hypothetical protein